MRPASHSQQSGSIKRTARAPISATRNRRTHVRDSYLRRAEERVYKEQSVKKEEGESFSMTAPPSRPPIRGTGVCNHRRGRRDRRLPESWRKSGRDSTCQLNTSCYLTQLSVWGKYTTTGRRHTPDQGESAPPDPSAL